MRTPTCSSSTSSLARRGSSPTATGTTTCPPGRRTASGSPSSRTAPKTATSPTAGRSTSFRPVAESRWSGRGAWYRCWRPRGRRTAGGWPLSARTTLGSSCPGSRASSCWSAASLRRRSPTAPCRRSAAFRPRPRRTFAGPTTTAFSSWETRTAKVSYTGRRRLVGRRGGCGAAAPRSVTCLSTPRPAGRSSSRSRQTRPETCTRSTSIRDLPSG